MSCPDAWMTPTQPSPGGVLQQLCICTTVTHSAVRHPPRPPLLDNSLAACYGITKRAQCKHQATMDLSQGGCKVEQLQVVQAQRTAGTVQSSTAAVASRTEHQSRPPKKAPSQCESTWCGRCRAGRIASTAASAQAFAGGGWLLSCTAVYWHQSGTQQLDKHLLTLYAMASTPVRCTVNTMQLLQAVVLWLS